MLVFHVDIETTHLLDAAHALYPEQQLALLLPLVFFSHALGLIPTHIHILKGAFADGVVVHPEVTLRSIIVARSLPLLLLSLIDECL